MNRFSIACISLLIFFTLISNSGFAETKTCENLFRSTEAGSGFISRILKTFTGQSKSRPAFAGEVIYTRARVKSDISETPQEELLKKPEEQSQRVAEPEFQVIFDTFGMPEVDRARPYQIEDLKKTIERYRAEFMGQLKMPQKLYIRASIYEARPHVDGGGQVHLGMFGYNYQSKSFLRTIVSQRPTHIHEITHTVFDENMAQYSEDWAEWLKISKAKSAKRFEILQKISEFDARFDYPHKSIRPVDKKRRQELLNELPIPDPADLPKEHSFSQQYAEVFCDLAAVLFEGETNAMESNLLTVAGGRSFESLDEKFWDENKYKTHHTFDRVRIFLSRTYLKDIKNFSHASDFLYRVHAVMAHDLLARANDKKLKYLNPEDANDRLIEALRLELRDFESAQN